MSIKLMSLVWELDLPPGEKLVLLALADQANDGGLQCWPSLGTVAQRSGQNERTVRRAIRSLETKGHLTCQFRSGDSTQYHVHPGHHAPPDILPVRTKTTETPDTTPPKPSKRTVKIPKKDKPSLVARAKPKHPMPEGWGPKPLTIGTICAQIVAAWQPGRIERELSKFRDHHLRADQHWSDWDAAWRTWIQRAGEFERPLNGYSRDTRDPTTVALELLAAKDRAGQVPQAGGPDFDVGGGASGMDQRSH